MLGVISSTIPGVEGSIAALQTPTRQVSLRHWRHHPLQETLKQHVDISRNPPEALHVRRMPLQAMERHESDTWVATSKDSYQDHA